MANKDNEYVNIKIKGDTWKRMTELKGIMAAQLPSVSFDSLIQAALDELVKKSEKARAVLTN